MVNVKIKKLFDNAILPTKAHDTDACFDIYANIPDIEICYDCVFNESSGVVDFIPYRGATKIEPGKSVVIHTGFCTEIPERYFAAVFCRSGMGIKKHLRLSNSVGIIDSSYRGEWMVSLYNDGSESKIIHNGDRIAQFALLPVLDVNLEEVDNVSDTERGTGGFGSSGV